MITFYTVEFSKYFVSNIYNSSKPINYKLCLDSSEKTGFSHFHVFLELNGKKFALKRRAKGILGKTI